MLDVTLSIMALIAGGFTLELFTSPRPEGESPEPVMNEALSEADRALWCNPS